MAFKTEKNYSYLALGLVMAIGLAIRLYHLGFESIWIDEGYSIYFAKLEFSQVLRIEDDMSPFYYALLHGWIKIFGDSEFSVRFPSLIFGVLSLFVIYKIGSHLFDEKKGRLAALLLALSTFHLYYSQEARMYSLTVLLTLVSMLFFLKLNQKGGRGISIGYTLSSTLLIYSHVFGLFILFAQNVYFLTLYFFSKKKSTLGLKHWIQMQVIIVILFAPWLPTFAHRIMDSSRMTWLDIPTARNLKLTLKAFSGHFSLERYICLFLVFMAIVSIKIKKADEYNGASLSLWSGYRLNLRVPDARANYLLLLWLLSPIIWPFLLSQFMSPFYHNRYTVIASLAFYLLVASGIGNLRPYFIRIAVIGVVIGLNSLGIWKYYHDVNREPWRDVARYIDTHSRSADLVLFNSEDSKNVAFSYYAKAPMLKLVVPEYPDTSIENDSQRIPSLLKNHDRIWVVLAHPAKSTIITEMLNPMYRQLEYRKYKRIWLYLYESKNKNQQ